MLPQEYVASQIRELQEDGVTDFTFKIPPYKHQRVIFNFSRILDRSACLADIGCVSGDTEYLSPTGWIRIDQYSGGLVAQYNLEKQEAKFVKPSTYIKLPSTIMFHIKTKNGLDQLVTPEHRILSYSVETNKSYVKSVQELYNKHQKNKEGCKLRILGAFDLKNSTQINISEEALRLQIAVMADGNFPNKTNRCRVRIKKKKKIIRLKKLLKMTNTPYRLRIDVDGQSSFEFQAPLRIKHFTLDFWNASFEQRKIICDEIRYWDATIGKNKRGIRYFCQYQEDADFIQYCFVSTNQRARLTIKDRGYHTKSYTVGVVGKGRSSNYIHIGTYKQNIQIVKSPDGFKYCFKVPSTFLILRRNGCVFITGNSGKTLPAICTSIYRKDKDKVKRVLVVTPASVKDNFAAEIRKNCNEDYVVLNGPLLYRKKTLNETDKFFVITNYDSLSFLEANIIKKKFDMLIADEISYCKNPKAKRSKSLYKIAQDIPYRIILTGSLLTNTPLDVYMPFKILDESIFGTSFWRFKERYCVFEPKYGAYGKYLEIVDFQNLDELQRNIYRISIRYRREDCLDLPPKVYETRNVELPIDIRKRYEQMKKELYLQYQAKEINAQNCLVKILKLAQITSGFISDDLGNVIPFEENPKFEELKNLLDEIDEKVIIWTRFRYSFEKIKYLLGDKAVGLCGDTKMEKRQELIDRFQTDDRCRYFVGMVSLGYGFNLTAGKVSIFFESDFSMANRSQAEGRNYRAGQESKVTYIDLICKDTIDEYVKRALERKENLAEMVMEILRG